MNQYVPDWSSSMGDAYAAMNGGGDDDGLIELLWCNGHVVMQSQAPRKPPRPEKAPAAAAQDDEAAAAWFQYPAAAEEDPLERDLFSELFGEAQAAVDAGTGAGRPCKEEGECAGDAAGQRGLMPPPPPPPREKEKACCQADLGDVSDGAGECAAETAAEAGESSMMTIGSSFCGSNHVQPGTRGGGKAGGGKARDAATVTSSSMRPRSCATKAGAHGQPGSAAAHRSWSGKRKPASDAAAETEDAEFESAADVTCEPAQKMTTAKRRRAAEVHNLSERRRRDRINEKMKALQELIPHCNKTDKASMLDEAIEYLKSLQLQLQVNDVDERRDGGGGGAGDVPGGGAPVHAEDGGGPSPRGVHAQDAVHGAAGSAEPGGGGGGRPLRALPRRRPPPAGGAAAHGSAALLAGHGLLPPPTAAAEPGAYSAAGTGRKPAGGDCTDDVAFRRQPAQKIRKLWQA
ncbi:unnamed protein product [Urochloa decumbens]|uniref:BHLH domain-containing protein n=1 Tax=Urochloa decumbens TaxID=240449 RepID=A0ABC9GF99_9POAL